jgi:DNA-binding Lrp family transcriptional regulator
VIDSDETRTPTEQVFASARDSLDVPAKREWFDTILSSYAARASISDRVGKRLLVWASEAGMSQREIAKRIRKPQTYVHRQLRTIEEDPSTAVLSPRELYEHFSAGEFDRAQLLGLLAAYPYESGVHPEGAEEWGYVAGSLDQLTQLAIEGSISRDELDLVLAGYELVRDSHA